MDLYILRHGKAGEAGHGMPDAERRLTRKGRAEIEGVARWMAEQEITFDAVAASPLLRAAETAAIIAETPGLAENPETWEELVPGGNPDDLCRTIDRYSDRDAVLIVGHEPLLSSLIGRIIGGSEGAAVVMGKGSLAKIRNFSFASRPSGELHWLLTAKQMAGRGE